MQRNDPIVNAFYLSGKWHKVRNAYYKSKFGICERCGMTQGKMIVHHKIYITSKNVNDPNITLNFDNLELLCIECHNTIHFKEKTPYVFDEEGNLIAYEKEHKYL